MTPPSALVRRALRSDAPFLASVKAAVAPGCPESDPAYFVDLLARNEGLVFVVQSQGSVIGFLVLQREGHPAVSAGSPLQLWQLYVAPAFQGSGVAAQLTEAGMAFAREHKHDVLWLGVTPHNARGMAFYRKQGFVELGRHPVGAGKNDHIDVVMSCPVR